MACWTASAAESEMVGESLNRKRIGRWLLFAVSVAFVQPEFAVAQRNDVANSRAPELWPAVRTLDRPRLAAVGIRVIEGGPLTLVTDVPMTPEIEALPQVIAAAVPHFAQRFDVRLERAAQWRVQACLIQDAAKFKSLGLMPEGREFVHGLALGSEVWLNEQPSDYFRRHLLLHEATHSFMLTQLGGAGPGWYMEGMAELLGTHRWNAASRQLTLGTMPANRTETPYWGRIKLITDALAEQRLLTIPAVLKIDNAKTLENESYAWVWALAHFLDHHPRYAERFHSLFHRVTKEGMNDEFQRRYAEDWDELTREWELFVRRLDYGYDVAAEAIEWRPSAKPHAVEAQRGWQARGVSVKAGEKLAIHATGRFEIGREPTGEPWPCEANGITLEYVAERPLGELQLAIDDRSAPLSAAGGFLAPLSVGASHTITAPLSGQIFLRVNDSPARRGDNTGTLKVTIQRAN